jgi:hypothetical protein
MPTQKRGMMLFTKFFWENFLGKKEALHGIRWAKKRAHVSEFLLGNFRNKKTRMPFFKNFFREIFWLKKGLFYSWVF